MLNVLQIGGGDIAIGMQWSSIPGQTSEKKEAAERANESGLEYGVIFNAPNSLLVGLHDGDFKKGLISGAAWLAGTAGRNDDFILVEPISDTKSWLCAIRGGAPLKGFDVVVDNERVIEKIAEAEQLSGRFTIYSQNGGYGDLRDSEYVVQDADFHYLTQRDGEQEIDESHYVVRLTGVSKKTYLVGAALVLAIGAYFGGTKYLAMRTAARDAEIRAETESRTKAETETATKRAIEEGMAKLDKELQESVTDQPGYRATVNAWLDAVGDVPTALAAWKLQTVVCQKDTCIANYMRFKLGTVDEFIAAVEARGFKLNEAKLNTGSISFTVNAESRKTSKDQLPPANFQTHLTSQLQRLEEAELSVMITDPKVHESTVPAAGSVPEQKLKSSWQLGTFEVSGKKMMFEVRDSGDYLDFNNVSAGSLILDFVQNNWKIGGFYAVK